MGVSRRWAKRKMAFRAEDSGALRGRKGMGNEDGVCVGTADPAKKGDQSEDTTARKRKNPPGSESNPVGRTFLVQASALNYPPRPPNRGQIQRSAASLFASALASLLILPSLLGDGNDGDGVGRSRRAGNRGGVQLAQRGGVERVGVEKNNPLIAHCQQIAVGTVLRQACRL